MSSTKQAQPSGRASGHCEKIPTHASASSDVPVLIDTAILASRPLFDSGHFPKEFRRYFCRRLGFEKMLFFAPCFAIGAALVYNFLLFIFIELIEHH
jgi:hypothetical protein